MLGALGVALVGALLFDMLLLSRGLVLSFGDLLDDLGYQIRVLATEGLPGATPPIRDVSGVAHALAEVNGVDDVIPVRFGAAEDPDGLQLGMFGVGGSGRYPWRIVEGDELAGAGDGIPAILLNRVAADRLGVLPGDPVRLRGRAPAALPFTEFRVVGIASFPFDPPETMTAAVDLHGFRRAYREADRSDLADMVMVSVASGAGAQQVASDIRAALPDLYCFTNAEFLDRFSRTDFSYFRYVSFALTAMTLIFAFLLVTTLLTVSVNQRLVEVATLRALGFDRRWITQELVAESALMVLAGAAAGLPLGALFAGWLDGILRSMPLIPNEVHFFVFHAGALWRYGALILVAAVVPSIYPVVLASRLPIAATLRREVVS